MRMVVALIVLLYAAPALAQSPRITALQSKPATEEAFWKQLAIEGTPIVEDVKDPKGRLLVTFVYRGKPDTKHVAAYGTTAPALGGYTQLERVPGTSTFAWSTLVDPAARFMYWFAPGDNFGPPTGAKDIPKRQPLWRPDLMNKKPYLVFGSMVELPKASAQPWLVPKRETPTGDLVGHLVKSKALGNERPIAVYTPHGFTKKGAKYPLVVMFDGPSSIPNLGLPIVLDEMIAAKKIPPVVVLLVGNADRAKELPANPAFADFVALDLVPWVRANFHATADSRLTVIAGISFGGIAAAFAAMRHPAVYGNVLSQSGSFWWGPEDSDDAEIHAHEIATRPRLPLRWWIECGRYELNSPKPAASQLGANRHVRDVLVAKGYDVTYREFFGAHDYFSWRGTIADGLIALLATPPKLAGKPPASPGKPGGIEVGPPKRTIMHLVQRGAMLDGGATMVAKLKTMEAALVDEGEVNQAAYTLLELQRPRDALPLLEWNVERFPKSQNVHDSLGEAYYLTGDHKRATASYKKSLELDPKNDNAKKMIELLR